MFAASLGGSMNDDGLAVAADKNGNSALGGKFKGTVEFGADVVTSAGNLDGYIVVFGPDGKQRFHRTLGSSGDDQVRGVAFDSAGNLIVVGDLREVCDLGTGPVGRAGSYSIFVAKYRPDGTPLWTRAYSDPSGGSDWAWAVAVDGSDNILVTGRLAGSIDFGDGPLATAGSSDVLLFKLRGNGSHVFSKRFGGVMGDDYGFAIAAAGNGDVLVTGSVLSPVDFGGGQLSGDRTGAFIARFGPDGTYRWARRLGPATGSYSVGRAIAIAGSGEVVITGNFFDDLDCGGPLLRSPSLHSMFLARYSAEGQWVSSRQVSATGDMGPLGLRIDAWGNLIVGGAFQGSLTFAGGPVLTSAGGEGAFLAKLAPDGTHLLSRSYGNLGQDVTRNVAVDFQGNMLAAGQFENRVDFGGGPITSNNLSSDAFLIKLSP